MREGFTGLEFEKRVGDATPLGHAYPLTPF
jgi:hypothetical protein